MDKKFKETWYGKLVYKLFVEILWEKNLYIFLTNKMQFFIWIIFAIGLSLVGIWFPYAIRAFADTLEKKQLSEFYIALLGSNPYLVFSIPFLAESMLSVISIQDYKSGSAERIEYKIVLFILCGLYLFFLGGILAIKIDKPLDMEKQHICFFITLIFGLLLFPLRKNLYKKTSEIYQADNEKKVADLADTNKSGDDLL